MNKIIKYTQAQEEQAIIKMYQNGLTAGDKSKIIKARKLPKNTMDHFDLFKTYFLSGEGLPPLIKNLSDKEKMVLHILAFNQWITDIRVFEAAYLELPKPSKYYYIDRGTFTQKYGPVLKAVQTNLVQKGLLVKYEEPLGGNAKAERQRFLFPTAFMEYLPSPFLALKTIEGKGEYSDENIRKELQQAIRTSPKSTLSGVVFKSNKLRHGSIMLNEEHISKIKLRHWRLADSALILSSQHFDEGKTFAKFIFFHLKRLAPNQWFTEDALATLLYIWDYPKKRKELDIDKKYRSWMESWIIRTKKSSQDSLLSLSYSRGGKHRYRPISTSKRRWNFTLQINNDSFTYLDRFKSSCFFTKTICHYYFRQT